MTTPFVNLDMKSVQFFILYVMNIVLVCTQETNDCAAMYSCDECIQMPKCAWCSRTKIMHKPHVEADARCFELRVIKDFCEADYIEAPEQTVTIKDIPVAEAGKVATIQLQPQDVSAYVRVGIPVTINLKFKRASDYPIDIYYLLDFSRSMRKEKQRLAKLGARLVTEMEKRTTQLQLGFGSFVDKVTLPYTSSSPDLFKAVCPECASPYSFKNHMPLSNKTSTFSKMLSGLHMSANEDTPEGSLDALLQAMVCTREINWGVSRRIIVLCTDASFHIAGDGKLGGVVEPHDGKCYLDRSGEYTHGLILDYPSISLINSKAKEHSMNIVFAATPNVVHLYQRLSNAIQGSSVGVLQGESDVIKLVIDQYNNMSVTLSLTDDATGPIEVTYSCKCPGKDWINTRECVGLRGGDEVLIRATIKVNDCSVPERIIKIYPIGMVEAVLVRLKVHCSCSCEKKGHKTYKVNATECSGSGNLVCGKCTCPDTHYGRRCECKQRDLSWIIAGSDSCRNGNVTCSGRGTCVCGTCRCEQPSNKVWRVSGDFCECDNFSCPGGSTICSEHGLCVCGRCLCDAGWVGNDCKCSVDKRSCTAPGQNETCSGRGDCICGECKCHVMGTSGKKYTGQYCERCTACKVECTEEMSECVNCKVHQVGPLVSSNCANCTEIFQNITLIADASEKESIAETSTLCRNVDENGCSFQYVPFYLGDQLWAYADREKTCPTVVDVFAISAGVAGSTVLAGIILLLLWKCFTTIHDKREYEKFEKQRADTKWGRGDNPLYRKAVTTHTNPTFEG